MRVIVREDHQGTNRAVQMVWYRVGSMDEHDGVTGVAHVTEHMMFKGYAHASGPASSTAGWLRWVGATTPLPVRTTRPIFQQVPASQLKTVMALEADRMRHLHARAGGVQQGNPGDHGRASYAHR